MAYIFLVSIATVHVYLQYGGMWLYQQLGETVSCVVGTWYLYVVLSANLYGLCTSLYPNCVESVSS
jgi:hypothetical protein